LIILMGLMWGHNRLHQYLQLLASSKKKRGNCIRSGILQDYNEWAQSVKKPF
jgi:hypothetical protein